MGPVRRCDRKTVVSATVRQCDSKTVDGKSVRPCDGKTVMQRPEIRHQSSEVREHQTPNPKPETRPVLHSLGEGGNKSELPKFK